MSKMSKKNISCIKKIFFKKDSKTFKSTLGSKKNLSNWNSKESTSKTWCLPGNWATSLMASKSSLKPKMLWLEDHCKKWKELFQRAYLRDLFKDLNRPKKSYQNPSLNLARQKTKKSSKPKSTPLIKRKAKCLKKSKEWNPLTNSYQTKTTSFPWKTPCLKSELFNTNKMITIMPWKA